MDFCIRDPKTGEFTPVTGRSALLPVTETAHLHIRAQVSQPAYLCLAWVDQSGTPYAIYPWREPTIDWGSPADFKLQTTFSYPDTALTGGRPLVAQGPAGLETLVLLVRRQKPDPALLLRLPTLLKVPAINGKGTRSDELVRSAFKGRPAAAKPAVSERTPVLAGSLNPVHALHERLWKNLGEHFDQMVMVSFPNAGQAEPRRKGAMK